MGAAQDSARYMRMSDSMIQAGKMEELIPIYEKELVKYPRSEQVLRWLGFLHSQLGHESEAVKYYTQAVEFNPNCARCYMNLGRMKAMRNDGPGAIEEFNKGIAADPKDPYIYSVRAKLKEMMGDKFGSLVDHNKAVQFGPEKADYLVERGLYHINQGNHYLALGDLNAATNVEPGNSWAWFQKASLMYQLGDLDGSLEAANRAIALDTQKYNLYLGRAAVNTQLRDFKAALIDFNRAIALEPGLHTTYESRSQYWYMMEDMDAYCSDLGTAFLLLQKQDPVHPDLKPMVSAMFWTCDSNQSSYWFQRGIANYNLQQYQKAVNFYTRGLAKFPGNSMTLSFRGNAHFKLKQYKLALNDYAASIANRDNVVADLRTNPKYEHAPLDSLTRYVDGFIGSMQVSIAESLFGLGKMEEALKEIDKGIALAAGIPGFGMENYYNVQGNILLGLGRYPEAKDAFDKALAEDPKFYLAYIMRAVAKANTGSNFRVRTLSLSGGGNSGAFQPSWSLPVYKTVKKDDSNLKAALADCNTAINLDPSGNLAWYLRGQIKQALGLPDFCKDISTARQMGFPKEDDKMGICP